MCEEILREYSKPSEELDYLGFPSKALQRHWLGHLISPKPYDCKVCLQALSPERRKQIEQPTTARYTSSRPNGTINGQTIVRHPQRRPSAFPSPPPKCKQSARDLGF